VAIKRFTAQGFRCLGDIEFEPGARYTLIHGANASGKTSLLEAIAYLGRGKSFRGAPPGTLIQHGAQEFVLFGQVDAGGRRATVGVRNSRAGLEVRIDGDSGGGAAALAAALPLQVIDPDVHNLVSGGPDERRRFLDWLAFHVEPDYLGLWRQFRRALKQRNAALKGAASQEALRAWDREFCALGERVSATRESVLAGSLETLRAHGAALLGVEVDFDYAPGWSRDQALHEALEGHFDRDRALGTTQVGPHRADLRLVYDERQARRLVSRGQQKLLASSMILAATETVQGVLERPLVLLLDDPAAELDRSSLARLMERVAGLESQVIATSLDPDALTFPVAPRVFHVEQGTLREALAGDG
jgi:DNA replication and repair protein RecF